MANPRKVVAYDGLDGVYVTYKIDNSTIVFDADEVGGSEAVGGAVKMSAADTVALVVDGNRIEGKLIEVFADGFCTVQVGGYAGFLGGDGATLTVGQPIVGAIGPAAEKGRIRMAVAAGAAYAEAAADENYAARGSIVNAADVTKVMVRLS